MTRPRHILFLNEFYHPDICATAAVLADRLPRIARLLPNDRISVITGNRAWDDPAVIHPSSESHDGVHIVRVDRPALGGRRLLRRGVGFLAFGMRARSAAQCLHPIDLVIGTTAPPQGGWLAMRIAKDAKCPFIYTVWDLYPDLAASLNRIKGDGLVYRWWHARDATCMRRAARVVCIGENMTHRIIQTRGLSPDRAITIHDGFDPNRLGDWAQPESAHPRENPFQARVNPDGRIVIQYAGNMGLSHPFETIMAAAQSLASDNRLQFQFIGGGPHRSYVQSHLTTNGILLDYLPPEQLGQLLSAADICLISQHADMFDKALPYKIYASLAAARPVLFVGNPKSEVAGWLRDHGAGIPVAQGDVEGLIAAIRSLADDAPQRKQMGQAARRLLDASFHSQHSAEKWATLISAVLKVG